MNSADELLADVLALPLDERARLALRLVESLDDARDLDAEALWGLEIAARIADIQDGKVVTLTAADSVRLARERLAARRG